MYDNEFNKPVWNIPYYANLNHQLEQEVGDFLRANTNAPQVYSNDLRHQYASALYARNLGDKTAKILGDANEWVDLGGSGRQDTEIDKINNEIGRKYGLAHPTMPKTELLNLLLNDHYNNMQFRRNKLKQMGL